MPVSLPAVTEASHETRAVVALEDWRKRVAGKNICQETLLATDYLNHFNEVTMLIELLPESPDMLEMCREWRPCDYKRHFENGQIADKELIIEAYDHVPSHHKRKFEATIADIDDAVLSSLGIIEDVMGEGDGEELSQICTETVSNVNALVQKLNGIIHGHTTAMSQDEIDSLLSD